MPGGRIDIGTGNRAGDNSQADGDQDIAAQVRIGCRLGGSLPRLGQETISMPTALIAPKQIDKTLLGLGQAYRPLAAWLKLGQVGKQPNPQRLNFDGIPFALRAGRVVGVHPSEMRRAENQAGLGIHQNAIGCPDAVIFPDAFDNGKERPTPLAHFLSVKIFAQFVRQLLDGQGQPKRRVGRFAVRVVVTKNGIGNRAVLLV